jgi:peptidyl-prolyl cis-trans isomerase SurA
MEDKTIAKVNGREIKRNDLDLQIKKLTQSLKITVPQEGTKERNDFEQEELNRMIDAVLLAQEAEKKDFRPKEGEVKSQYDLLLSQVGGEEKLVEALNNVGITKEQLREDMAAQMMLDRYLGFIKEKNGITVTDEEIKDFYEKEIVPQDKKIELKDIEVRIRQVLEQQKLNQPLSEIVQDLRSKAEIVISLL